MLFDTKTVPTRRELLTDLAAFGVIVVVAVVQGWKASDIVWASWITSLLTGLSFFLIMSIKMLRDYAVARSSNRQGTDSVNDAEPAVTEIEEVSEASKKDEDGKTPSPMDVNPGCLCFAVGGVLALLAWLAGPGLIRITLAALIVLDLVALVVTVLAPRGWFGMSLRSPAVRALYYYPTSLFMFFFFLMHFGGFHAGHVVFLSSFVPPEVKITATAGTLVGIRESVAHFLGALILAYWPYVVSVAVKSVGTYRAALVSKTKQGDEMMLPYKNVIRIHLMIFALVPLAAIGSPLVLTIVVLAFFFFPVESVVAWLKSGRGTAEGA